MFEQLENIRSNFLNQLSRPSYNTGKSIVTTAYDKDFPSAYILLSELKRFDIKIPVEVFYGEGELSEKNLKILEKFNIELRKIDMPKPFIDQYKHKQGWGSKVYAILNSKYEENLWIDSDNFPIKDPTFLFDDIEYLEKGSLFWRDIMSVDRADMFSSNSIVWKFFGVPNNDSELFESGQFLINKDKCWKELFLVKHYTDMGNKIRPSYYDFGGDKDCWKFAFQYIDYQKNKKIRNINYHEKPELIPYGFMPYGPFHCGKPNIYHKWGGGSVLVQRDREGRPLFNHRNINKFSLNDNVFNVDVENEQLYHNYISELNDF